MRRPNRLLVISALTVLSITLINPLELYKEFKDSQRMSALLELKENVDLYIKYNSGSRVNLGLVGTVYNSSSELTDSDGEGWLPIKFRSSGVKLKKLPLDPVNKNGFVYTFSSSSDVKYKLSTAFESQKYLRVANSDEGISSDLYELGTDLTLNPSEKLR